MSEGFLPYALCSGMFPSFSLYLLTPKGFSFPEVGR